MNTLITFASLLLVGLAAAAPVNDDILHVDQDMYPSIFEIYTGENEITRLVVPLNSINFEEEPEDEDSFEVTSDDTYIFFIEAEKGLFVLKNKTATKLLENGRDIAATSDDSKQVYLGASDGIYTFNAEKTTAEKYGSLTDDIISLVIVNGTNELYFLTADHVVYKVTDDGNGKEEVTSIKDAQQIVLDTSNNLYYVDSKKQVYVRLFENGAIKHIKGLPSHASSLQVLNPPVVLEDCVPIVAGKKVYLAYANGTAEFAELVFDAKPSAVAVEATLLIYAARDKKIYEYNLLNIIVAGLLQEELNNFEEVQSFFSDQKSEIQSIATRPMKSIRAR